MNGNKEIEELVDRFYKIISGKAEEERNWETFRTLFFTNAQLTSMRFDSSNRCVALPVTVESYIAGLAKFLKTTDFYEHGFGYQIVVEGDIAHAYSRYEARYSPAAIEPVKKGTCLIQLANNGSQWLIVSMLWQDKRANPPL